MLESTNDNSLERDAASRRPRVTVFYHFFYPDDVVSARHFSDFCEELTNRGWAVQVFTSNRLCRQRGKNISPSRERWKGIDIIRAWRPSWDQASNAGRLLNAAWLMVAWLWRAWRLPTPDYWVVGSDPQFSQFMFPVLKLLSRKAEIVFWCFDLYPEAVLADAPTSWQGWLARHLRRFMRVLYKPVDVVVDVGPCMRQRLAYYECRALMETLVPWALVEPAQVRAPDNGLRDQMWGPAKLALLYSGTMGRAHEYEGFLALARRLRAIEPGIVFAFSCQGNRFDELRAAVGPKDINIRFLPFAPEEELEARLTAADIHLLSLRPEWSGIVIPSKFFGSLAVGRPVLYSGAPNSAIPHWIEKFDLGMTLTPANIDRVIGELVEYANDPQRLYRWQRNAFSVYQMHFSKKVVMDRWDQLLRERLPSFPAVGATD